MSEVTTYRTKGGERWDTIAYAAYGDALLFPVICAANPDVPLTATLPQGLVLYIPVLSQAEVDVNLLPPWKR
jgi:phage tail protein X